jgi:hypothetical protein
MGTLEQLFGYAILCGVVPLFAMMVRDQRRGWVAGEDRNEVFRRAERPGAFLAHQLLQLAKLVVLVLTGLGVLGYLWWERP